MKHTFPRKSELREKCKIRTLKAIDSLGRNWRKKVIAIDSRYNEAPMYRLLDACKTGNTVSVEVCELLERIVEKEQIIYP